METKRCTKCGEEKPATQEYFYRDKGKKSGIKNKCKECAKSYTRSYYKTHPEKLRERNKKWHENNLEKSRETSKKWRKNNPEKVRARQKRLTEKLGDSYVRTIVTAQFNIPSGEISNEIIEAKRRQLKYYRELRTLKKEQNETK